MEERMWSSGFCIAKARTHFRSNNNNKKSNGTVPSTISSDHPHPHPHPHPQYGSGTKCGRWNPTAEQVKVLTELFRSGLRTPSTDQIQKISSQLSFYGKIESKNVFYWFQNHKARERQKRRRRDQNDVVALLPPTKTTTSSARYILETSSYRRNHNVDDELDEAAAAAAAAGERVMETQTLQLFPLNSFKEALDVDHHIHHHHQTVEEKLMMTSFQDTDHYYNHHHHQYYYPRNKDAAALAFSCGFTSEMDHPPLDLRLSFL